MNTNNETGGRKVAIVYAGTDGHGVTMGVISSRNLRAAGFEVILECKWPETGKPSQFWGETFLRREYSGVALVVATDIPLPEPDGTFPNAVPDAIAKIRELAAAGTSVVIIDHHKVAETHYGEARRAGAQVVVTSSATTCFYGEPTLFSEKWGRFGAVCDLEDAVLPVTDEEELLALGIDAAVRKNLPAAISAIERDDAEYFRVLARLPEIPGEVEVLGQVSFASDLTPTWGFKQLSRLSSSRGTDYAVGVDCFNGFWRVIAITNWKRDALPVALKLGLTRFIGHGSAILVPVAKEGEPNGREQATAKAREFVGRLNSSTGSGESGNGGHTLFAYVSAFMRRVAIPFFLTQHGWPHVQRVVANVRTLASLFELSERDRRVLDWVALFHDVGNGANTYYPTMGLSDKEARDRHHEFSAQMVREWRAEGLFQGILSDEDCERVADISYRHRKKVPLPADAHEAMLCVLFRVADGMDIDARRAQRNDSGKFYEDIDLPEDSVAHWEGHRAIESLRISAEGKGLVFELVVTNSEKAAFQVAEISKELSCLTPYCTWSIRVLKCSM